MPAVTLGAGHLLEYNARHKLLICRQCRYAIQKNALESHLLRHKIYRGERQHLLSSIARLDLLEPENVPLPTPGSPPIDILPVLTGFRCAATGCHHLTASEKRMKRHWSEVHDTNGSIPPLSSIAHPVELQTFFRGTKVRYFEVVSPEDAPVHSNGNGTEDHDDHQHDANLDVSPTHPGPRLLPMVPTPAMSCVPAPSENTSGPPASNFNLETLTYFHHYMTEVAMTLPGGSDRQFSQEYWQKHAIARALQQRWLMCGLMALSAHHLATLVDDRTIARKHIEVAARFDAEFITGLDQMQEYAVYEEIVAAAEEDAAIGRKLTNLLHCARWASHESTLDTESLESSELLLHVYAVRDCFIPCVKLYRSGLGDNGYGRGSDDLSAPDFLQTRESSQRNLHVSSSTDNTPSEILDRLRALPYRFAERLAKPDNSQDVFTTLTAITTMVECCETSFASDEPIEAWQGLATWLTHVPAHFIQSLEQYQPAALVLLAYWAATLVRRAERTGCWFLKNFARNVVLYVTQYLTVHARHVLDMVEGLKDLVRD